MKISSNEPDSAHCMPWNCWFREAKAGSPDASHRFFLAAEPYIRKFYREPFFRNRLGSDEIHSLASFALVKLMTDHARLPPDEEVPYLLRRVIRCELLDGIRVMDTRLRHEQPGKPGKPEKLSAAEDGSGSSADSGADGGGSEPELRCLKQELRREVRKAMEQLPERHRTVIDGLFFRQKATKEIAREMRCSPQNVRVIRTNAMARLRRLLKPVLDL